MKNYKILYLILSIFFLILSILFNLNTFIEGSFPENILLFALTIITFCLFILSDHFIPKDERTKKIKEKSIYSSFFLIALFLISLYILSNIYNNFINITNLIMLIISFQLAIVFISFVYHSKKY